MSVTLGLGFYAPLLETHGLLKRELATSQGSVSALQESLARAESSVERVNGEVADLEKFKEAVASEKQRYPKLAEAFSAAAPPIVASALTKKDLHAVAKDDAIAVAFVNAGLFNRQSNSFSWAGSKLACPVVEHARKTGLPQVTVRGFTPEGTAPTDMEDAHRAATALAADVAQQLVRGCGVPLAQVSVASSVGAQSAPLLQLEFREATPLP